MVIVMYFLYFFSRRASIRIMVTAMATVTETAAAAVKINRLLQVIRRVTNKVKITTIIGTNITNITIIQPCISSNGKRK